MCQARALEEFLEWAVLNTRVLVINGDIFDDLNFKRLTKRHFACLKIIRRNSDRKDFRLIWIRGNHDGPADTISHIVGVEIRDQYIYANGKVRLLILHGDQFDNFITDYKLITYLGCYIFYGIQKWAPHNTARWIRRVTKKWQRNSELVQRGAIDFAKSRGCRFVTCGHTHLPLVTESNGVRYLNTGTWIEHPPHPFVSVRGDDVRLDYWPPVELPGKQVAEEQHVTEVTEEGVV
jgi:UDP-2,3-diacylglucosamine pyrophosphatase LpxH